MSAVLASLRRSYKAWLCQGCGKRWMYQELPASGRCPNCGGTVIRNEP